jgi:adenylosuccinate synthase
VDGVEQDTVPFDTFANVVPVYKEFKGWSEDMTGAKSMEELPKEFIEYLQFIESEVKVPIKIISVGPDRDQTIIR